VAYLAVAVRVLTGLVFLVAIVSKARSWRAFEDSVRDMSLARPRAVARVVVAMECLVVVAVAVPVGLVAVAGLAIAAGLNAAFIVGIRRVIRRGVAVDCRCFGGSGGHLGNTHVVRDAVLAGIALIGAIAQLAAGAPGHPAGWLVAGFAGAAGALVAIVSEDIIGLFASGPALTRVSAKES
jgi:hypothetical protein